MNKSDERAALGRKGEKLAWRLLKKQGCRRLAKNWSCARGEIDLIVRDGATIVFVEVKLLISLMKSEKLNPSLRNSLKKCYPKNMVLILKIKYL